MSSQKLILVAAFVGAAFVAITYVPDLGRGFVKDDFGWIKIGVEAIHDPVSLFTVDSSGFFFRPLVTASFAADYGVHGLNARGYGFTNLALCLCSVAAMVWLFRVLGLSAAAVAVGVLAWVLNPHAIGMALLWISGRTSLLMTLFSTLAVLAFLSRRRALGASLLLCAMFAKEDAVAVPLIIVACEYAVRGRISRKDLTRDALWMAAAGLAYIALRLQTRAMMPSTAPWYYQLSSNPWSIAINGLSYLDRGATGAAIIAVAAIASYRVRPVFSPVQRRLLTAAAIWFVAGLAITVRLPVRSDLYALFPSVGAALACASLVDSLRASAPAPPRDAAMAGVLIATLLLIPVYRARDQRYVEPARLSAAFQERVDADRDRLPSSTGVMVLQDEPGRFSTFGDAFDGLVTDAVRLYTGRAYNAEIVLQHEDAQRPGEVARYALVNGMLRRVR